MDRFMTATDRVVKFVRDVLLLVLAVILATGFVRGCIEARFLDRLAELLSPGR
jgi:hypothetical protein